MEQDEPSSPQKPNRRRRRGKMLRFVLGMLLALLVLTGGYAYWYTHRPQPSDTRVELFPGVLYICESRRTPRPIVIHIVTVALDRPEVSLLVTPGDPNQPRPLRARTTSQFLKEFGLQIAINGDFFFPWWSRAPWNYYPHVGDPVELEGHAVSRGVLYSFGGERWKFPVLYFTRKNQAVFNRVPKDLYNAIAGSGMLLVNGEMTERLKTRKGQLDPRAAVALDKASKTLILAVVDGRQPNYSEGVTQQELAEILRRYGGHNAMNLDGGGSATLVVADKNGNPLVLNCPIDNRIPGRERPVANHLGVYYQTPRK
jgi:hypothetical protein